MSKPEIAADGVKMQEASEAYAALGKRLENCFTSWEELFKNRNLKEPSL